MADSTGAKIDPEFKEMIRPLTDEERGNLKQDIEKNGCLDAVKCWRGLVVDGHNRFEICGELGVDYETVEMDFDDRTEALSWIISNQLARRNLTTYEVSYLRGKRYKMEMTAGHGAKTGSQDDTQRTRTRLAKEYSVSPATISRDKDFAESLDIIAEKDGDAARQDILSRKTELPKKSVIAKAAKYQPVEVEGPEDDEAKAQFIKLSDWEGLDAGKKSEALKAPGSKAGLNKQSNDSIEWARWSWNPVTGCNHPCPYCYARDIANRWYEQRFEPSLLPDRLKTPFHHSVPQQAADEIAYKNIFVCSMADLFGRWVPKEWIEAVLNTVRDCPQWNFLFLTKFPKRMAEFEYPENAWLGTSVDHQAKVKPAEKAFEKVQAEVKWLSVEPLLEPIKFSRLEIFDWVVVGGSSKSTQTPEWHPPFDWVVDLHRQCREAGSKVYFKTNLLERLREYPGVDLEPVELPDSFQYWRKSTG